MCPSNSKNKETKENLGPSVVAWASDACTRRGVLLRTCAGIRIAFCPPLIITEDEIDSLFDRWELALDDTLEYVKENGLL